MKFGKTRVTTMKKVVKPKEGNWYVISSIIDGESEIDCWHKGAHGQLEDSNKTIMSGSLVFFVYDTWGMYYIGHGDGFSFVYQCVEFYDPGE